ncbi:hypothetical protein F0562_015544 [Nyssa sinensis]|uniref:Retrotransposon Copia-like N-terminal domain-containing protein n=1 Tax=Nyssa sinensis TaxID=561372 RepID=A0A5J4ZHL0_9ASTE|nr:hypothetical protein F0562_015544 [Nyssa sinensis]
MYPIVLSSTSSQKDSSSVNSTSSSILNVFSSYFLHSAKHPRAILVSNLLNGDNYSTWKWAMKMALNAKHKLGFVDGTLTKPTSSSTETKLWERFSDKVLSWIFNSIENTIVNSLIYHNSSRDVWLDLEERFYQSNNPRVFKLKRDISTLTQDSMSISAYFTTLKGHWDELDMLTSTPPYTCGTLKELIRMQDTEHVFQFLMGLHDSYAPIRTKFCPSILYLLLPKFMQFCIKRRNVFFVSPLFNQILLPWLFLEFFLILSIVRDMGMVVDSVIIVDVMVIGKPFVINCLGILVPSLNLNLIDHLTTNLVLQ